MRNRSKLFVGLAMLSLLLSGCGSSGGNNPPSNHTHTAGTPMEEK